MKTLYIRFKNKDEIEIPNVNARELEEAITQFPENGFLIFYQSNQIINLKEINYMEIIESEEK